MLGGISQLFVTIILGTVGLVIVKYFFEEKDTLAAAIPNAAYLSLLIFGIVLSIALLLFYLRIAWLTRWLIKIAKLKKIVKYLHFLAEYSRKELLRILLISSLRYFVFILQYMLLLSAMQVIIAPSLCFWLLTIFYLTITLAPTIGFTELPVRAAASTLLLQLYSSNVLGIQAASLSIWCLNVILPALVGSLLIFGLKIIREKDE